MKPIPGNFKPGGPVSQVPAEFFNLVADWINKLAGYNCTIERDGTYPRIRVDASVLNGGGKRLWSLSIPDPLNQDTVAIQGSDYAVCIGGTFISCTPAPLQMNGETYIYLTYNRQSKAVVVDKANTLPARTDLQETHVLWIMAYTSTGTVDLPNCIDVSGGIHDTLIV